jgi:signal transduction histidine kinase
MLRLRISIRKKIILAISFFILVSSLVWSLNYYTHHLLTNKLQLVEEKVALLNTILEARRYEKNFFLYFNVDDLSQAVAYISAAQDKQAAIIDKFGKAADELDLPPALNEMKAYRQMLITLSETFSGKPADQDALALLQGEIRERGQKITGDVEKLAKKEQAKIYGLARKSRIYLYLGLAAIVLITLTTVLFINQSINRPLKRIEYATHKIAQGDYTSIPDLSTGDQFESLVRSLNRMIVVLNQRNDQLMHAQKLASLGTLTSGVAHELNNPLNNISTSVQILQEELAGDAPAYHRELLRETEAQVDRAKEIIRNLLEFSREKHFIPVQTNFRKLTLKTIKLLKSELPAVIDLKIDIPPDLEVTVDPHRIQRVLMNLVVNAVQAIEGDTGQVEIRAGRDSERNEFYFSVSDTGKGIPIANQHKIFDPFFTTKEIGLGTGLGLSVSHGIVDQHGGRIEVSSRPGDKTTLTIRLPLPPQDGPGADLGSSGAAACL